ncbi:YIF1-domain-containing protein [Mucidula mucida]|nr:YIF1-domain-containing protein [Mucidula mucida]
MNFGSGSHSPPPLRHPVPTHPAYIPEPPVTPGSPDGYQRFSSSPQPPQQHQQQQQQHYSQSVPAYSHYQPPLPPNPTVGFVPQPQARQPGVDFSAWGVDDATARLGMQLGNSALGGFFPLAGLKHRFNVNNLYVMRKLQLVVFPWRHKPWSRKVVRSEQGVAEWYPPREDVNSPDLYIPIMAIVTYILVAAFHSGLDQRFRPQVLGELASASFAVVLVDFGFVYLGCYFLNIQGSSQALDIIAYSGYKFVGVISTILAGYVLGRTLWLWTIVFLYFFLANAFFLLRSLRSLVLVDPANSGTATISPASRRRRITFLFLEAVLQILYMGILVRV